MDEITKAAKKSNEKPFNPQSYGKAYRAIWCVDYFTSVEKVILQSLVLNMDMTLFRQHNIKYLEYVSGLKRTAIKTTAHGLRDKGYITIQSTKGHGNIYSICQKLFDDYVNLRRSANDLLVDSDDDEELLSRSANDQGRSANDQGRSANDPLIENYKIENYKIENYTSPLAAGAFVDKSDLCQFDEPDPFKAFESIADLDQGHEVSLTASKDGLKSISEPELVLDASPEPKAAKKRLKRDLNVSKQTDKSKQTESTPGSLFFDHFNFFNKKYFLVEISKGPTNYSICKNIVAKIPNRIEQHIMLVTFFRDLKNDFITKETLCDLGIFLHKIDYIRKAAARNLMSNGIDVNHYYANAKLSDKDGCYIVDI